jgi:hypothetical protein
VELASDKKPPQLGVIPGSPLSNLLRSRFPLDDIGNPLLYECFDILKYTTILQTSRTTLDLKVKLLSLEPLIGPLGKLNLKKINWVIVGGESGPGARPIMQEWVTDIRDQCLRARVPFFFKQWGGVQKKRAGRTLEGRTWDEMPVNVNMVKV